LADKIIVLFSELRVDARQAGIYFYRMAPTLINERLEEFLEGIEQEKEMRKMLDADFDS